MPPATLLQRGGRTNLGSARSWPGSQSASAQQAGRLHESRGASTESPWRAGRLHESRGAERLGRWGVRTCLTRSIAETAGVWLLPERMKVFHGLVVANHPKRHDPPVFELNDRFATLRADWVFVELGVTE